MIYDDMDIRDEEVGVSADDEMDEEDTADDETEAEDVLFPVEDDEEETL
ncbi:MAG TPA: hypothetical protein VEA92_00470 [Candidatus Paceibacterota bacterium]|nr:hypothetical protein [Candidatus Paceibacterota bacterium]